MSVLGKIRMQCGAFSGKEFETIRRFDQLSIKRSVSRRIENDASVPVSLRVMEVKNGLLG